MWTLATVFGFSFAIALSGAMMPGPVLTVTVSESSRRGPWAGPLIILGHGILELLLVVLLFAGLAPLLQNRWVFLCIAAAGAVVLVWMAVGMFRSLPNLSMSWSADEVKRGRLVVAGILLSLANPYWAIWWATIGLGYVLNSRQYGLLGIAAFFTGHILADLAWYSAVSLGVAKGRRFLSDRVYRGIIGTCAVFLVGFAAYFLVSAVRGVLA